MLGSPEQGMNILEQVQCRATRMITGLRHVIREKRLTELEKAAGCKEDRAGVLAVPSDREQGNGHKPKI